MADAELHIIVKRAGDPEKLGALLNAAIDMREAPAKMMVPVGYHCVECYNDDGSHATTCSIYAQAKLQAQKAGNTTDNEPDT